MLGCGYKALRCRFALWGMALGIYKRQLYWAGQHMGCDPVRCRWCEWAVSAMHMCGLSRPRAPPSSTSPPVFFPKTYIYETEYAGEGSSHCVRGATVPLYRPPKPDCLPDSFLARTSAHYTVDKKENSLLVLTRNEDDRRVKKLPQTPACGARVPHSWG